MFWLARQERFKLLLSDNARARALAIIWAAIFPPSCGPDRNAVCHADALPIFSLNRAGEAAHKTGRVQQAGAAVNLDSWVGGDALNQVIQYLLRVPCWSIAVQDERQAHVAQIGVVFGQRTQLWWDLPVEESFELLRDIYRVDPSDYRRTFDELATLLDLAPLADTPVRQLSLDDQEVIYLRFFLELSEMETAQSLGLPVGTVKSRLHRALARLRKKME